MTGTSHGNVFDYFNTFSAVLDWWFLSKPECQKLSYLVSRVLEKILRLYNLLAYFLLQIWYFERKLKFEHFCPGEVIVRQNDIKKLWRTKRFLLAHWFGNVPKIILSYFWAKTKIWTFCPGEVRVRQNDRKNYGVPKNVYWPIGLKMFHKWFWATFERKLKFEYFCPG